MSLRCYQSAVAQAERESEETSQHFEGCPLTAQKRGCYLYLFGLLISAEECESSDDI